jgi:hypothetical protein
MQCINGIYASYFRLYAGVMPGVVLNLGNPLQQQQQQNHNDTAGEVR